MKLPHKDYFFVGIQFLLFFIYLFNFQLYQLHFPDVLAQTGLIIGLIGIVVLVLALLQLSTNLSPFPTPKSSAQLIQTGLYKLIRHPIYTGIILLLGGYGFYKNSVYKISITLLLYVLFYFKSSYEEKLLQNKYSNYLEFKKTRGRFFPKLF